MNSGYPPPSSDLGPLLFGTVISAVLYGITVQQIFIFFMEYDHNSIGLKIWMLAIWLLDTLTLAFSTYTLREVVLGRMDLESQNCQWSRVTSGLLTGFIIFLVQMFFIVRIWKVRRSVYPGSPWTFIVGVVFTILALFALASSVVLNTIRCSAGGSGANLVHKLLDVNIAVETFLDILLTVALVCILRDHRNEFSDKSNSPIERLIAFFIARGVGLTAFQVASFFGDVLVRNECIWFAIAICTANVYTSSVLATVNNRDRQRTNLCATPEEIANEVRTHLQFAATGCMATRSVVSSSMHVRSQTTVSLPIHLNEAACDCSYENSLSGSTISLPSTPSVNRPWLKPRSH